MKRLNDCSALAPPIALLFGREGYKLDHVPLKLWFLIIGIGLIILGLLPDGLLIALGVGSIIISIILYLSEGKKSKGT